MQKDMDEMDWNEKSVDEILAKFGVKKDVVGVDGAAPSGNISSTRRRRGHVTLEEKAKSMREIYRGQLASSKTFSSVWRQEGE